MQESRMDCIEREMAEFLQGMRELRESQKKTDEQFRDFQKENREQIREMREFQRKTDEQFRDFQKENREQNRELREAQKKTDAQIARNEALLEKTIKRLDNIGASLGEMGLVQGKVAEDLFYRNVKSLFEQRNLKFADVRRNLKKKGEAEYDIVAAYPEKCSGHRGEKQTGKRHGG
ncbi:MAG: hypothetical protein R2941_22600 [Desulfobacterales bacterium]